MKDAVGGTLRQLLAAQQNIDFINTAYVDLGNLNWTAFSTNTYVAYPPEIVSWTTDDAPSVNILCSNYKIASRDGIASGGIAQKNNYIMFWTSMTATELQNSMKGVLLAYKINPSN